MWTLVFGAITLAAVLFALVQIGEGAEDRRRRVAKLATRMRAEKFPEPLINVLDEYAVADKSGMVKAIWDFRKLMKNETLRKAMLTEFQENQLDLAVDNPERFGKLVAAVEEKKQKVAAERERIYQEEVTKRASAPSPAPAVAIPSTQPISTAMPPK